MAPPGGRAMISPPMPANAIAQRLLDVPPADRDRIVLTSATGEMTYGGLRHGMLAHAAWLSGEGVGPGARVAIAMPKTMAAVALAYGVLAAGAAYVPLQFNGPMERLARILSALDPALFIGSAETVAGLRRFEGMTGRRLIGIEQHDVDAAALARGISAGERLADVSPHDLAAVFFTSGSTGEPKGVMWSHRGMAAALAALPRWRRQSADDRLIAISPLHYSASAEIFYPVFSGASIHLCTDREILFPAHLAEVMERQRITIWSASATALRLLVERGNLDRRDLQSLRRVEMYGERMPIAALGAAMAALPQASFNNLYAASEAFDMIEYEVPRPLPAMEILPLGRPSPTYRLSLRDDEGCEVPAGQIGEICVVGPAVTIGYWNDPALSESRRLANIADSYRTGDLARLDGDGLYRLVGRRDHQVKLRGNRFDLGEIEAAARSDPRVRDAVAFAPDAEGKTESVKLAVLSEAAGSQIAALLDTLRRIFAQRLPAFARPGEIAVLDEFPRLASGKIDRQTIAKLVGGTQNKAASGGGVM